MPIGLALSLLLVCQASAQSSKVILAKSFGKEGPLKNTWYVACSEDPFTGEGGCELKTSKVYPSFTNVTGVAESSIYIRFQGSERGLTLLSGKAPIGATVISRVGSNPVFRQALSPNGEDWYSQQVILDTKESSRLIQELKSGKDWYVRFLGSGDDRNPLNDHVLTSDGFGKAYRLYRKHQPKYDRQVTSKQ
jgi:hypothetical protein